MIPINPRHDMLLRPKSNTRDLVFGVVSIFSLHILGNLSKKSTDLLYTLSSSKCLEHVCLAGAFYIHQERRGFLDQNAFITQILGVNVFILQSQLTRHNRATQVKNIDAVQREVVELRFLTGLFLNDVALVMDKSVPPAKALQPFYNWTYAVEPHIPISDFDYPNIWGEIALIWIEVRNSYTK